MADLFLWLFGISIAIAVISNVYWIVAWVRPTLSTNARDFIKAFKNKMPLVILDDGRRWTFHVGKKFFDDSIETEDEGFISIYPNSLKFAKGILMAVGEGHRGITVTPSEMRKINNFAKQGYRISDIMRELKEKGVINAPEILEKKAETETLGDSRKIPGGEQSAGESTERKDDGKDYTVDWGHS